MADNVFKGVTAIVTTVNEVVYTAPEGVTSIVINAQITNTTRDKVRGSFSYVIGATNTERPLVKDFEIDGNDSYSLTTGRLVINEGDSVKVQADQDSKLKLSLSLLETAGLG